MPVYLRNFYYNKLVDTRKKETEEIEKAQKGMQQQLQAAAQEYMSQLQAEKSKVENIIIDIFRGE